MRKSIKYKIALILFGTVFIGTIVFLIVKSRPNRDDLQTIVIEKRTIEKKIMASGSIVPKTEVEVKSSLSGVVDSIFVKPGDLVEKGDPILSVKVVPNSLDLNSSESAYNKCHIILEKALLDLNRSKQLYENNSISESEYKISITDYNLAEQDYLEASNRIMLLKEGKLKVGSEINNIIYAPISGTVLSLPLKPGAPIQENGGLSVGTTIANMADMDTLYFKGTIDEAQIANLFIGLPVHLSVAAIDGLDIVGELSFISPRGDNSDGAVIFPIEIGFPEHYMESLRAGYSASAEIVLEKAEDVVSILERDIIMEDDSYYVDLIDGNDINTKKITLGVSNGIYSEVTSGLLDGDIIRVR